MLENMLGLFQLSELLPEVMGTRDRIKSRFAIVTTLPDVGNLYSHKDS